MACQSLMQMALSFIYVATKASLCTNEIYLKTVKFVTVQQSVPASL